MDFGELFALPPATASRTINLAEAFDFGDFDVDLSSVPVPFGADPSSGSGDQDGDGAPKKKRARLVHANYEHLGACDTCRKRRVKCIRLNPDNPICEECRTREIECTQLRNGGLRYKPRARKKPPPDQPTKEGDSPSSGSDSGAVVLSNHTAQGRLVLMEESSGVMASLMDQFLDSATFGIPIVHWANLRLRFERAGRRPNQLDPMTETLVLACIAFGAFSSDHPSIVGQDGPRLIQLSGNANQKETDLSHWSKRRMPHCRQLVDKVVQLIDSRGLFRVASPETAGALFMTAELLEFIGEFSSADPFVAGAVMHTIRMHDEGNATGNDLKTGIEWGLAIGDCFQAAVTGLSLLISDEQIEDLLEVSDLPPPSVDLVSNAMFAPDWTVGHFVGPFWFALIQLNRHIARRIATPLRKNRTVTIETLQELVTASEQLFHLLSSARDLANQLSPMVPAHLPGVQRHQFGADALSHFRALPLSVISTFMILAGHFKTWKERRRAIYEVFVTGAVEDPEEAQVAKLDAAIGANTVIALCTSAMAIKEFGRINALTTHLSILMAVQKNIDACATVSVHLPCADEGGPPSYPRALKIEVAQTFIDALRLQSWTWGTTKASLADACQAKLDLFKTGVGQGRISAKGNIVRENFKGPPPTGSNAAFWHHFAGDGLAEAPKPNSVSASAAAAAALPQPTGSNSDRAAAAAMGFGANGLSDFLLPPSHRSDAVTNNNTSTSSPDDGSSPQDGSSLPADLLDFLTTPVSGVSTASTPGFSSALPEGLTGTSHRGGCNTPKWLQMFSTATSNGGSAPTGNGV